jgi:GH15 family glucan-1,4-alpha-glucosidase
MRGTVAAVARDLLRDGFVRRYRTEAGVDGVEGGEGAFLPCSFWLADAWAREGRIAEAQALLVRLRACCNDVGLLAEEVDPASGALLGNFPQAFSHIALLNTARLLRAATPPAPQRGGGAAATPGR